jgi:hypothetical protein
MSKKTEFEAVTWTIGQAASSGESRVTINGTTRLDFSEAEVKAVVKTNPKDKQRQQKVKEFESLIRRFTQDNPAPVNKVQAKAWAKKGVKAF